MIKRNKTEQVTKAKALVRWSGPLHLAYNLALPITLLLMVRGGLVELSILLVFVSKWRVFSVKPRHFIANLKANLTDLFVKLGSLIFIINADSLSVQLLWTVWYAIWLIVIKPRSSKFWMAVQAVIGQSIGISALFLYAGPDQMPFVFTLALVWLIAKITSRHFLMNYDDEWRKVLINMWSLFVVQLTWIAHNWFISYLVVPQVVILLLVFGYLFASLYDASKSDKLTLNFILQQSIMSLIIILTIVLTSDWRGVV